MVRECDIRSAQKIFVGKPEWKRPLETDRWHVGVQTDGMWGSS